jgi:hypothetical protein
MRILQPIQACFKLCEEADMKSRFYSLFLAGLAFLSISSYIGCGQSQSEAYQEGYKVGFADGYQAGIELSRRPVSTPSTTSEPNSKTETPATSQAVFPAGAIS